MDKTSEKAPNKVSAFLRHPVPMTPTDWLVDCVIAAGAFGFGLLQLTFSANIFVPDDFMRRMLGIHAITPSLLGVLATLAISLPLVARRRYPWPVFVITLLLWMAFEWTGGVESFSAASPLVALFTLACECERGQTAAAASIMLAVMLLSSLGGRNSGLTALLVVQNVALVIAVAFAGYALKARGDYLKAAEERAEEAEKLSASEARRAEEAELTRESEASRRVEAERVRIARELHDVTAHSLSAVSIQAAAAERLVDVDPAAAKESIAALRATAKEALADMRSMVGVLRSGEDAQLEPTEGTERMASLAGYLEDAGVECDLFMQGYDRAAVPTHVDVALFGIAREACTNVVRHAHASKATIALRDVGEGVVMYVCDDGRGMPWAKGGDTASAPVASNGAPDGAHQASADGGHGIEGMRERVRLLDGTFDVAPSPQGGTCVEVFIPAKWKEGRA